MSASYWIVNQRCALQVVDASGRVGTVRVPSSRTAYVQTILQLDQDEILEFDWIFAAVELYKFHDR